MFILHLIYGICFFILLFLSYQFVFKVFFCLNLQMLNKHLCSIPYKNYN